MSKSNLVLVEPCLRFPLFVIFVSTSLRTSGLSSVVYSIRINVLSMWFGYVNLVCGNFVGGFRVSDIHRFSKHNHCSDARPSSDVTSHQRFSTRCLVHNWHSLRSADGTSNICSVSSKSGCYLHSNPNFRMSALPS